MVKNKVMDATSGIVTILEPLASDERTRVIKAALTVLGEDLSPLGNSGNGAGRGTGSTDTGGGSMTAKKYFELKAPQTKIEELATAARYREQYEDAESNSKDELRTVFKSSRHNFDDSNFNRDIENARTKGLFNKGTGKDSAVLSHYGQNYVDTLPDRDAVKGLRRPTRKAAVKKKITKKVTRK